MVKVGSAALKKYPNGLQIEDCAKVTLSPDLSPDVIMEKLHISDCAMVACTKEQEEAVNMIAEGVAMIKASGEGQNGEEEGRMGSFFGKLKDLKDTQMINAAEYKM